jgi:hypothetical protein
VSPKQLPRLYRLAWFTSASAVPELRIQAEGAGNLAMLFAHWPALRAQNGGGVLRLSFPETGRWGNLQTMEEVNADTWTYFASGSILELATCSSPAVGDPAHRPGSLRFRGVTEGRVDPCVWKIAEAYPAVDAATLRAALALSEAAENGKTLALASADEAKLVLEAFLARWGDGLTQNNPIRRTAAKIGLKKKDTSVLYLVAAEAFRSRYGAVWPCAAKPPGE